MRTEEAIEAKTKADATEKAAAKVKKRLETINEQQRIKLETVEAQLKEAEAEK